MTHTANEVAKLIEDLFRVSVAPENFECALTGEKIRLSAIDLFYLVSAIEKKYEIRIPENAFISRKFNSVIGISEIVCAEKEKQQ